jgi:hypothetical protein
MVACLPMSQAPWPRKKAIMDPNATSLILGYGRRAMRTVVINLVSFYYYYYYYFILF